MAFIIEQLMEKILDILFQIFSQLFNQITRESKEHDSRIFHESNDILTERKVRDTLDELLHSRSIQDDDFYRLTKWLHFFEEAGNQYLIKSMKNRHSNFRTELDRLTDFIADNFFDKRNQDRQDQRHYLYPELRYYADRGDSESAINYAGSAKQLDGLTRKTREEYSRYRYAIKRALKV